MARRKGNRKSAFGYLSYTFKDHDPILDEIDTLIDITKSKRSTLAIESGVSDTTLRNWHLRGVKKPQFATIKAVVQAAGGELAIRYKGAIIK